MRGGRKTNQSARPTVGTGDVPAFCWWPSIRPRRPKWVCTWTLWATVTGPALPTCRFRTGWPAVSLSWSARSGCTALDVGASPGYYQILLCDWSTGGGLPCPAKPGRCRSHDVTIRSTRTCTPEQLLHAVVGTAATVADCDRSTVLVTTVLCTVFVVQATNRAVSRCTSRLARTVGSRFIYTATFSVAAAAARA